MLMCFLNKLKQVVERLAMKKRYVVRLTPEEREQLHDLVHKGRVAAYKRRHAQVLLLVDQGEHGPGHADRVAAERVEMHRRTVEKIRQRCVLEGLDARLGGANEAATAPACWTVKPRRNCWPSPARNRPRDARGGRCTCWWRN